MSKENTTLSVYDQMADDYVTCTQGYQPAGLADFIAAHPKGSRVLDLGCGPGLQAAAMARAGLDVLAVDGSAEMVTRAAKHAGVTAKQALFNDIPTLGRFDGIWANFSLLHAPRTEYPRHLADLHATCRPDAVFTHAMKLGTGEGPDRLGRFYCYYSEDDLHHALEQACFTVTKTLHGRDKGLAGDIEDWIVITAHA